MTRARPIFLVACLVLLGLLFANAFQHRVSTENDPASQPIAEALVSANNPWPVPPAPPPPPPVAPVSISGRIYDVETGAPLVGMQIILKPYRPELYSNTDASEAIATTDANSQYSITGLAPDDYELIWKSPPVWWKIDSRILVTLAPDEHITDADFQLPLLRSVSGRILDARGKPIAGARLLPYVTPGQLGGFADALGRYEVRQFAPGERIVVSAAAPGLAPADTEHDLYMPWEGLDGADIVLREPAGSLDGLLVDEQGKPMGNVAISLGQYGNKIYTGEDGRFEFYGIRKNDIPEQITCKTWTPFRFEIVSGGGPYSFGDSMHLSNLRVVCKRVEYEKGDTKLPPTSGQVVDEAGNPVEGATVRGGDGKRIRMEATTDAQGNFALYIGAHERCTLLAYKEDWFTPDDPDEDSPDPPCCSDDNRLVLAPISRARGKVINAATGAPITRFRIHLIENDYNTESSPEDDAESQNIIVVDPAGEFDVRNNIPGEIGVWVKADGFPWTSVNTDRHGEPITIALEAEHLIEGITVDESGVPIADVRITHVGWRDRYNPDTSSKPDGSFRIGGLGAGEYTYKFEADEWCAPVLKIELGEDPSEELRIVMQPFGEIAGIIDIGSMAITNSELEAELNTEDGPYGKQLIKYGQAESDGSYTIFRLVPGVYTLTGAVTTDDGHNHHLHHADVTVRSGETTTLNLTDSPVIESQVTVASPA